MRLTLGQLKVSADWARTLGMCVDTDEWLWLVNQALERLMHRDKWVGTVQRYQLCTSQACITLPRQFQTIEVMNVCSAPMPIRNGWFEFIENGPGRQTANTGTYFDTFDRGRGYAMFSDPTENCVLRLVTREAGDAGKVITIRGLDTNGDTVYTNNGATVGEEVTLVAPGGHVDTVTQWKAQSFRDVIKAATAGYVDVYWYPVGDDSSPTKCAQWEPSETLPDYRRYYCPYITQCASCDSGSTGECGDSGESCVSPNITVTCMVKMAFIPVENDSDFLPLSNVSALKLAMKAVMLEERGDYEASRIAMEGYWDGAALRFVGGAIPLLQEELNEQLGDGVQHTPRIQSRYVWGYGGVENNIG